MSINPLNTDKIKVSEIASRVNELIPIINISSRSMVPGEAWWGTGTQNLTITGGGMNGGITRKLWPYNNSVLCEDNLANRGIFMYKNLTIDGTVNINGDFGLIFATESITITSNGNLQLIRNPLQAQVPYAQQIPGWFHGSGRNSAPPLNANDPSNLIGCSTGGGGGGGSGNTSCDGGFYGDDLRDPRYGTTIVQGGQGGVGGSNSAGNAGYDATNTGSNSSFKFALQGGTQLTTIAAGVGSFRFNVPSDNSRLVYSSNPGHQSFNFGGEGLSIDIPIIPGGNGGPGGGSRDYGTYYGGYGGLGGGVIYLISPKIVINAGGAVRANGRNGTPHTSPGSFASGAGGGGGGGLIMFICQQDAGSMLNYSSIDTDMNAAWSSWPAGHWYETAAGSGGYNVGGWPYNGNSTKHGGSGGGGTQMIRVIQSDGSIRLAH